ncbi:cytochrome c maturation protein CcmE [Pseudoduganella ginsengisoli]|uniref:Cytochrome c-type biogenesis protein CcmE n=1 Tax=Pseudoduganella ginsengisoli TaxID=1462440 RepID=A0A6L6PWL3_9BURK|nr:cytochrome c maturation protein CcmE [Pseudoduganella ginsengisoli]MTW01554.1 cytochrome c maturation protein CcmE [Pseudoduganella ginsengisoli]
MTGRHKRLALLAAALVALGGAAALVLSAFQKNLVFFYSPAQVASGEAPQHRSFRLGGMVQPGSVQRDPDGLSVRFAVTDYANTVQVRYKGIVPDLFREGKGVVAQGRLDGNAQFVADEVLAKHDENYMPPEAAQAVAAGRAATGNTREKWSERGAGAASYAGGTQ